MDGENNGSNPIKMDGLGGGFPPLFLLQHPSGQVITTVRAKDTGFREGKKCLQVILGTFKMETSLVLALRSTLPETNIAGWKIHHFDDIYQERWGFSWANR